MYVSDQLMSFFVVFVFFFADTCLKELVSLFLPFLFQTFRKLRGWIKMASRTCQYKHFPFGKKARIFFVHSYVVSDLNPVFQIRDGSRVNGPIKKATWPDKWNGKFWLMIWKGKRKVSWRKIYGIWHLINFFPVGVARVRKDTSSYPFR